MNETIKTGTSIGDSKVKRSRPDESANSREVRSEEPDNKPLGSETPKEGIRDREEEGRAETNPIISRLGFKTTIPVMSYGSIQPEIEFQNIRY